MEQKELWTYFCQQFYQSPKTDNNPSRFNYEILENTTSGITTLSFSGYYNRTDNVIEFISSDSDVNQMRHLGVEL